MSNCSSTMNSSYATYCGGSFAAHMTSALLLIAGIALAMSVVFFSAVSLGVRLCIIAPVVIVSIITLIAVPSCPQRRKR